jgi:hypothetical protein
MLSIFLEHHPAGQGLTQRLVPMCLDVEGFRLEEDHRFN